MINDTPRDSAAGDTRSRVPLKERLYRTDAVVLSRLALGEADRILTIFTPRLGKLRVIAKGARRPTSRLGAHLEYFTEVGLMLARGRDLDTVTSAETIDPHLNLRSNLTAFGHACHIAELLLRLTEDRQEQPAAYDLLARSLRLLDDGVDPFAVTRHFELALLGILGYRPELYQCVICGSPLTETLNRFIPARGGFACDVCRDRETSGMLLSVHAQKYLRTLDRHGLAAAARLVVAPALQAEVERFATTYLRFLTERELNSLRIWHALEPGEQTETVEDP